MTIPELGHSCRALAISVLEMFFSPALNSSLTDSNLVITKTNMLKALSVSQKGKTSGLVVECPS